MIANDYIPIDVYLLIGVITGAITYSLFDTTESTLNVSSDQQSYLSKLPSISSLNPFSKEEVGDSLPASSNASVVPVQVEAMPIELSNIPPLSAQLPNEPMPVAKEVNSGGKKRKGSMRQTKRSQKRMKPRKKTRSKN